MDKFLKKLSYLTSLQLFDTTACHGSQHFISFHFISFHFISFHFISFHFISFHFIALQAKAQLLQSSCHTSGPNNQTNSVTTGLG